MRSISPAQFSATTARTLAAGAGLSLILLFTHAQYAAAQDSSSGTLRGHVQDTSGARIPAAIVNVVPFRGGATRRVTCSILGEFFLDVLPPGDYKITATSSGMAPARTTAEVHVGAETSLSLTLQVAGAHEAVQVTAAEFSPPETPNSDLISSRAIAELPLNGRRFTDLALLTPGVTQDPRGLNSGGNGDLSFGGIRGFQTSFQVDGADNNNAFFAQARGRYRAPYQFSDEVIQEFRISSNAYGAEQGRAGGAVLNVVTKSGSNHIHGSLFYDLRDGRVAASHPFVRKHYPDRQTQFGATLGGPLKRDRVSYFLGFDQHIFHVPAVVQFANGATQITALPSDYEATDQALVAATAAQLSRLGGLFHSSLLGNTAFAKLDASLSRRHQLNFASNLSRYYGSNNVFFDPASPITQFAMSENGEEDVTTKSLTASLASSWAPRWTTHIHGQFAQDFQGSLANSPAVLTKITGEVSGFGRSAILPRHTHETRYQLSGTAGRHAAKQSLKFGGDILLTRITNFFPEQFGGQYKFDTVKVNPFTFAPQTAGLSLSPLRAYAHGVPRYYSQDFGNAFSYPDSNDFSLFGQEELQPIPRLALSLGLRYDKQTFSTAHLQPDTLVPEAGKVPQDLGHLAPRFGFSAALGHERTPLMLRGGFGIFVTRIPQIYNSQVELENGLTRSHLLLDNHNGLQRLYFPAYPNAVGTCNAITCTPPAALDGFLTHNVSAFAANFRTPYVEQGSLSLEKTLPRRNTLTASYLFVAGEHLIRARDVNLPAPTDLQYPVFDSTGNTFTGDYYPVQSFASWSLVKTLTCPFPPCIDPLNRPNPSIGAVNMFESTASSRYHGFTLLARHEFADGIFFRVAYTYAKAIDNGQDALVVGRPAQVQNSANPAAERGLSSTDQRHRLVAAFSADPHPISGADSFGQRVSARLLNDWRFSGIFTAGSGRPVNAKSFGDPNRDGNDLNDRLPGVRRNSLTGPDYMSQDLRLTRKFSLSERFKMEAQAESFNLFNRNNKRVDITDDAFTSSMVDFVEFTRTVNGKKYPGYFTRGSTFLKPNNAYAPRQVQFGIKMKF